MRGEVLGAVRHGRGARRGDVGTGSVADAAADGFAVVRGAFDEPGDGGLHAERRLRAARGLHVQGQRRVWLRHAVVVARDGRGGRLAAYAASHGESYDVARVRRLKENPVYDVDVGGTLHTTYVCLWALTSPVFEGDPNMNVDGR